VSQSLRRMCSPAAKEHAPLTFSNDYQTLVVAGSEVEHREVTINVNCAAIYERHCSACNISEAIAAFSGRSGALLVRKLRSAGPLRVYTNFAMLCAKHDTFSFVLSAEDGGVHLKVLGGM
jgi:hypothetical protein